MEEMEAGSGEVVQADPEGGEEVEAEAEGDEEEETKAGCGKKEETEVGSGKGDNTEAIGVYHEQRTPTFSVLPERSTLLPEYC